MHRKTTTVVEQITGRKQILLHNLQRIILNIVDQIKRSRCKIVINNNTEAISMPPPLAGFVLKYRLEYRN
jgi:hypothetical protein